MQFIKASPVHWALLILVLCSCNPKQKQKVSDIKTQPNSLVPFKVTVIAELPDSLQPKTIFLEQMPKPSKTVVPENGGITKMLPVLQNEKGEAILDADGNPFILGDGGKSNFTTFTTDDGLALDAITCSTMDKFGNLWFGTYGGGVSRYDGKSFTNFTTRQGLTSSIVISIKEDKNRNLWFGTQGGGVSRYDGQSFTTFTTAQGLGSNYVLSIEEDKSGKLWFGTGFGGGASRYDGKSFTNFTTAQGLAHNDVGSIKEDKSGKLWFGTLGGGVSLYNGKSFTTFTTAQGLASNIVSSTTIDKRGNLWFGTYGSGVSRYNGKSFTTLTTAQGLGGNYVSSISADKADNLWFGTSGGVSRYDGQSFTTFTSAQGLVSNNVGSITEDKAGNLWFGTRGGGVSRYNGESFTNFTTTEGLSNNSVFSILEDKAGNLWFGTRGGGSSRYDGKSFTTFTTAQGLAANDVISITEDKAGNLWFGTDGGASLYDGKSFTNFTTKQGLPDNTVWCITEDRVGNIWFGTNGGVSRHDGQSFTNFTTDQGLVDNPVGCITEDKAGNLWIGTDNGVSRFDGQSFINFTTAQGLLNNTVWSITEDKTGNLWFGTREGLCVMRAQDARSKNFQSSSLFKNFKIEDGLPDNVVTIVIQLPDGKMAVGTNLGIGLFNISADFTKLTDIEIYNSNTGYPIKDLVFGQNCMLLDSKGFIWAGTGNEKTALVRFDRAALNTNSTHPTLVIQSIKVNEENVSWYDLSKYPVELDSLTTPANLTEEVSVFGKILTEAERKSMQKQFGSLQFKSIRRFYPVPENLVLPFEHNHISFEFAAIETSRPQMIKYQYMLEGYDKDWSPVVSRSNATFGNISEGTYTFKLKARGANGVWTEPVIYKFRVLPPWWRSWWAYGICISLLILTVWRVHLFQKAVTIRKEREKIKDRELAQAKEIEKAYSELGVAHENLKSTQTQLIQSEKLASLGELTAGIAHEIQNPLNFVNNFAEVSAEMLGEMEEELDKGDTQEAKAIAADLKQNLEKINHHGKRASGIVKSMLEHSRTSTGTKEPTDLNALADEYLRLAYHGLRAKDRSFYATMETHFDPDLPLVSVIPQDIGRVFLNLINNALYAVGASLVDARTEETLGDARTEGTLGDALNHSDMGDHKGRPDPTLSISSQKENEQVVFKIKDNGPGIPESIRDKIFQPFFTTKPTGQGTGLGLSLAYDIVVKGHGGALEVESTEGIGTTFIVKLPFL
ncbi:MAG: two-component regulator propeller domain-containing protein [Bacteroidia bacterium]|nr:two-component regulator propeller domain-containing protein [Bacteroidia bacterium]